MGRVILLTGASGFIGREVARRLLDDPEAEVVCLVMTDEDTDAGSVLTRAWWDAPELAAAI